MTSVIQNHNNSLLKDPTPTYIKECGCRRKPECSLDKKSLSAYLVYNASVDWLDTNEVKHYYGTCEKNLKERYNKQIDLLEIKVKKKELNSQNTSGS